MPIAKALLCSRLCTLVGWRAIIEGRWSGLASVPSAGLGSFTVVAATTGEVLLYPMFPRSALDKPANVVASKTGEGAALASSRLVGVGPNSHCRGVHDR